MTRTAVMFGLVLSLVVGVTLPLRAQLRASDIPQTIPLSEIKPGMRGVAYTIFEGDTVEKVDLVVIGVLKDALGPKEDVILVQLLGDKAEHSGVVAGMSGSPVYFDGKLAGAISLKIGTFTKEAIGGVTPIENMRDAERAGAVPTSPTAMATSDTTTSADATGSAVATRIPLPADLTQFTGTGGGQFLVPIETPLIAAGLYPQTLAQFDKQLSSWGVAVMAGGTAPASPEDFQLKPGDMVGVDLIRGDLSLSTGCTVTTVDVDEIMACGHPIFGYGQVRLPMSRAHVIMTLASSMASTKIISTGGVIGTLTGDRSTAIMGKLGAGPPMVPMEIKLETPAVKKDFHFEVIESPQLTPLLVALAAYNGIVGSPAYGEGSTLQLDGSIEVKGHTAVQLQDLFAPTDAPIPSGYMVAMAVQSAFSQIYSNPYEIPQIEKVDLHITALAERRWAMIENAWIEKSEVHPGETVSAESSAAPVSGRAVHSGDSDHDPRRSGAGPVATGDQRRRHGEPERSISGGKLAGAVAGPGRADQAGEPRAPQRPPVRNPAATHSNSARRRQRNAERAGFRDQRAEREAQSRRRATAVAVDGGPMVRRNASSDCGRARADDYRKVNCPQVSWPQASWPRVRWPQRRS